MRRLSLSLLFAACTINGKAPGPHAAAPAPAPVAETLPTEEQPVYAVVPDLRGLSAADANARVHAAGFVDDVDTEHTGTVTAAQACTDGSHDGRVCGQFPAPGASLNVRGMIAAQIGRHDAYADHLVAPDVRGLSVDDARAAFTRAGFTAQPHVEGGACKAGTVCGQTPAAGDRVYRSELIVLYVGS